ncbi:MAG: efflux RND transporter permease subunit [Alphaproteobacteria bacterium]|nr:efflux RND transporter permease subunit [Alphaproteobacteria bacterium]
MVERVIEASVRHRVFVLLVTAMLVVAGIWAVRTTPVDAIPDLSDVQVIVYTDFPGQAPGVVEDQVTYPLSTAMLSVPYARDVRGYSFFGFSLVYVIFEDGTDLYWARSRVLEYLNVAQGRLPQGARTQLGPDATGVGWVYAYTLTDFTPRAEVLRAKLDRDGSGDVDEAELPEPTETSTVHGQTVAVYAPWVLDQLFTVADPPGGVPTDRFRADAVHYLHTGFDRDGDGRIRKGELLAAARFRGVDLAQLRSVQDWYLRYDLTSLPGVSEVASVGGFVRQYQVEVDPERLRAFGVTLRTVKDAIARANQDVGGRLLEMAEHEYIVRGRGYIRSLDDLLTIPVALDPSTHTPILLQQLASVHLGPDVRRGLVDLDGQGEAVSGIVLLRSGNNALEVIDRVTARLAELEKALPPGVEIHTTYDRSHLIRRAIHTLWSKLGEELAVITILCLVFLLHLRSSLVAVISIPISVLGGFLLMRWLGVGANIMSLGGIAIAIGDIVDASVVMVENLHKHKEREPDRPHLEQVIAAANEVGPALFFSLAILTVSFLPVLTLQAQEGRMFTPLAWTKTLSMGASTLVAITLIPVLMVYLVRGRIVPEARNPLSRFFIAVYRPVLRAILAAPGIVVAAAALIVVATWWPWSQLGSEFMPPLDEGDLLYMPTTPPGMSIHEARQLLQETDRLIASHPQVQTVWGKIGRADTATDPAPLTMIETTITLTPRASWPAGKTVEDVTAELDALVQFPGLTNAWTMPIKTRTDMLATGIKTPVGVKLLGDDLTTLAQVGQQLEAVLSEVPGAASVFAERAVGGQFVDIEVRRGDAARYGLNVADVQDVVASAIGGTKVTETVEGLARYPVNVRYPRELRDSPDALARVAVPTPMGHYVPLGQVADITLTTGPPSIKSENARRTAWVYVDLDTDDVGGFVARAKEAVGRQVVLPPGVSMVWSGQYAYMERAKSRLALVIPLTLGVIVLLLYAHFRRLGETVLVLGTLPFALVGGVWLLWLQGFNTSVAVAVGFIALAGLAAETGILMLVYLEEAVDRYRAEGRLRTVDDLRAAISEGAVDRVRPKLMTVMTNILGLLPVMAGDETGVRIMKRIAAPLVGGLASSTVLTLLILPAAYLMWHRWRGVAPPADR